MFYSKELMDVIKLTMSAIVEGLNVSGAGFVLMIAFVLFFQILTMILIGFSAIIKGHSYNNGKVIKSFIWFAIYYVASCIASLIIIALVLLVTGNISEITATVMKGQTFIILIVTALIIYIGYTAIFYFISNKLFNKGVNVD